MWGIPTVDTAGWDDGTAFAAGHRPRGGRHRPGHRGKGVDLPGTTSFDLGTVGYEQNEYFLSGTASAYSSASPLATNGRWTRHPDQHGAVQDADGGVPADQPKRFDGTVVVEWLNVSGGVDAAAAWLTDHVQMIRSGMVYIGVSAQATGIVGYRLARRQAGQAGGIKGGDPARYGSLEHPGTATPTACSSRPVPRCAATRPVLGGSSPSGCSPSESRSRPSGSSPTSTRLQPQSRGVFDGYFVYSRGGSGAALSQAPQPAINPPTPTLIRTDLTCRS